MRGYAAIITGTAASMISFDCFWNLTQKPIEFCMAASFFIGFAITFLFVLLSELISDKEEPVKESEPERVAEFVEIENGLSVMIQGRRRA